MHKYIAVLSGDGIGPEVVPASLKVLQKIEEKFSHRFELQEALVGGAAIDAHNNPLPPETITACEQADAIFFGSIGGPKWDAVDPEIRPEKGLLRLRKHFDLFANFRPARIFNGLEAASPLKQSIVTKGVNILVVRELTGGIYFGSKGQDKMSAWDEMKYSIPEVERIARIAFQAAEKRSKKVCSIDKSNVLNTSRLWRSIVEKVHQSEFAHIQLSHLYVDNATMQLLIRPFEFDVILAGNMFGDIISDEAAQISGSLGMLSSASLNAKNFGLYEPAGGSAPDIAGKDIANPIAQILSLSMLLKYSFGLNEESKTIESAIQKTLDAGYRTADICSEGMKKVGTQEMAEKVSQYI